MKEFKINIKGGIYKGQRQYRLRNNKLCFVVNNTEWDSVHKSFSEVVEYYAKTDTNVYIRS